MLDVLASRDFMQGMNKNKPAYDWMPIFWHSFNQIATRISKTWSEFLEEGHKVKFQMQNDPYREKSLPIM